MAEEKTTLARPYADAVFQRAVETDSLDAWSELLAAGAVVVDDPQMSGLINSPKVSDADLQGLMESVMGDLVSAEGRNFLAILIANDRLSLMPEIASLYEAQKAAHQNSVEVEVTSAYAMSDADCDKLAAALKQKLNRDVTLSQSEDKSLIGGAIIRAGDMVIDGSLRGRLESLQTELSL